MDSQANGPIDQLDDLDTYRMLPFYVFVLICDRDKDIRPRAAARFHAILADGRQGMSARFRQMLGFCRDHFQELWRSYADSKLQITPNEVLRLLQALKTDTAPADCALLERDLARLARRLYRAGFVLFPRPVQKTAYADFKTILQGRCPAQSAVGRKQGQPEAGEGSDRGSESRGTDSTGATHALEPEAAEAQKIIRSPSSDREAPAHWVPSASEPDSPDARTRVMPMMPGPDAAWARGPLKLVCMKVTDEARGVRTFSFAHSENAWFRYQPGQFLTIEPVIDGKPVPRSYTISSTPTRPGLLEITVKRLPGGRVSNWLHENIQVGRALMARGPFGKFTCLNFERDKYLFLSAGSGITPLMSMLRYLHDLAAPVDVVFFHSATTQDDIVFRKELSLYGERNPNLRVHVSLTGEPVERAWDGLRGRLDNGMLHQIAPDFMNRVVLACGPVAFMDKAKQLLAGNSFPLETQFDEESFLPRPARTVAGPNPAGPERKSTVIFARSRKTIEISMEDTILEAAEKCHIDIPSSCRQGRCGTCRVTKLSGNVLMPEQEALSPDEIAQGEILSCIGQPGSSIVEVEL